eukprot:gene37601-45676_t
MSCTAYNFGPSPGWIRPPAREECAKLLLPVDPDLEVADLWVKEVTVGYAGGKQPNPTYKKIKDHTEAVRIVYDPNKLSYDEILDYFVQELGSPPFSPSFSRQYRPAILFHSLEQQQIAMEMLDNWEKKYKNKKIFLDIEPATDFYMAEEYHQKYFRKQQEKG